MAKKNVALTRVRRELAELTTNYNQVHSQRDSLLHEKRKLESDLEQLRERFTRSEANFARAVEERNAAIADLSLASPKVVSELEAKLLKVEVQNVANFAKVEELRALTDKLLARLIGE